MGGEIGLSSLHVATAWIVPAAKLWRETYLEVLGVSPRSNLPVLFFSRSYLVLHIGTANFLRELHFYHPHTQLSLEPSILISPTSQVPHLSGLLPCPAHVLISSRRPGILNSQQILSFHTISPRQTNSSHSPPPTVNATSEARAPCCGVFGTASDKQEKGEKVTTYPLDSHRIGILRGTRAEPD